MGNWNIFFCLIPAYAGIIGAVIIGIQFRKAGRMPPGSYCDDDIQSFLPWE